MKLVKTLFRSIAVAGFLFLAAGLFTPPSAEADVVPPPSSPGHCCRSTLSECAVCCPVQAAYGDSAGLCFATLDDCVKNRTGICYPCGRRSCG